MVIKWLAPFVLGLGVASTAMGAQCPAAIPKGVNVVWNVCDAHGVAVGSLLGQGSVIVLGADGVPYALPYSLKGGLQKNAVFAYAGNACVGQAFIIDPGDDEGVALGQFDGNVLWKAGAQEVTMTAQALYYTEVGQCYMGQHYLFQGGVATVVGKLSFVTPFSLK